MIDSMLAPRLLTFGSTVKDDGKSLRGDQTMKMSRADSEGFGSGSQEEREEPGQRLQRRTGNGRYCPVDGQRFSTNKPVRCARQRAEHVVGMGGAARIILGKDQGLIIKAVRCEKSEYQVSIGLSVSPCCGTKG